MYLSDEALQQLGASRTWLEEQRIQQDWRAAMQVVLQGQQSSQGQLLRRAIDRSLEIGFAVHYQSEYND